MDIPFCNWGADERGGTARCQNSLRRFLERFQSAPGYAKVQQPSRLLKKVFRVAPTRSRIELNANCIELPYFRSATELISRLRTARLPSFSATC
jgi:hypothetical protein